MLPRSVPSTPSPTSCPFDEEGFGQGRVLGEVTSLNVSHLRFILVCFQGIIHELEEVWSDNQVVFQDDDFSISVDLGGDSINNVSCQSPIFISLDEGDLLESLDASDIATYFIYSLLLEFIFSSVSLDKEMVFRS